MGIYIDSGAFLLQESGKLCPTSMIEFQDMKARLAEIIPKEQVISQTTLQCA